MVAAISAAGLDWTEHCFGLERTRAMLAIASPGPVRNGPMQSPTGPAGYFAFSSDDLPPRERAKAVRELYERGTVPLEPGPAHSVHVRIAKHSWPGCGILSGTLCGLRQTGAKDVAANRDDIFLGVNLAGGSAAFQQGREIILRGDDAILLSRAGDGFTISR